jgi:hypothetical protein
MAAKKTAKKTAKFKYDWISIRQVLPIKGLPVPVANYRREPLPYFAYLDPDNTWRNAHSKMPVAEVDWWLERWPEFPPEDVPEKDLRKENARLNKLLAEERELNYKLQRRQT